jgi:hypothetical protein
MLGPTAAQKEGQHSCDGYELKIALHRYTPFLKKFRQFTALALGRMPALLYREVMDVERGAIRPDRADHGTGSV